MRKNILLEEVQKNPYGSVFAVLEQAPRECTAKATNKPLRTQLQTDRQQGRSAGTRKTQEVIVPTLLGMLSPTPSAGRPVKCTGPTRVPSTISLDVFASAYTERTIARGIAAWQPECTVLSTRGDGARPVCTRAANSFDFECDNVNRNERI